MSLVRFVGLEICKKGKNVIILPKIIYQSVPIKKKNNPATDVRKLIEKSMKKIKLKKLRIGAFIMNGLVN